MVEENVSLKDYENLDRIITTTLLKKTVWKNLAKKHFVIFINKNEDMRKFLEKLEGKTKLATDEIENDFIEYMDSISVEIAKFRVDLKKTLSIHKAEETKLKEDAIFQRKLQEMCRLGKKQELESKIGVQLEKIGIKLIEPEEKTVIEEFKIDKPKITFKTKKEDENRDTSALNLGTFYAFLQQVIKMDLLVIKDMDGNKLVVHDLDLDLDPERIRMKVRKNE
jgi:hypothetical protein